MAYALKPKFLEDVILKRLKKVLILVIALLLLIDEICATWGTLVELFKFSEKFHTIRTTLG